jgi:hypothetical protein
VVTEKTDLKARKRPAVPDGYESEEDFLKEMRELYDFAADADQHNREAALQDIEFTYGEQWDQTVRNRREKARKPCLTINRLPAYVGQVVNNRLLNETEIRVYPDKGGTKPIAEVRQGIIKSIFKNSDADFARDEANKYQVIAGLGWFHMDVDYAADDVFEQDIKIKGVADPMSVLIDEMSVEPTGADAQHGWISDIIPIATFKKRYPWASQTDFPSTYTIRNVEWFTAEGVRVVTYWRMVEKGMKTLALMTDGTTQEIDDDALELMLSLGAIATRSDGSPYVREVPRRCARKYICSGANILEGPYDLPVSSLPIFKVPGWELRNGDKVYRWGLVRMMKDPQRLHNYQRSLRAEAMTAAPRNKWVATKDAVSGYEKDWRNSHLSDDPLLMFNAEGGEPKRIAPPPVDSALLLESEASSQDMRDVSNIHEATLGIKSNEVSGKALQERQAAADLGSYHYRDRMRMADERCAKLCNELIPTVYDTQRLIVVMGTDNKAVELVINDPSRPETDVTLGKYGVSVSTGPSTITKRALAAEQMMAFVNAVPESAAMVMDLVAEAQDWPVADQFAQRFRQNLPAGMVPEDEMTPQMKAAQAQMQQKQQIAEQIGAAKEVAEIKKIEAQAVELLARAEHLQAQAAAELSNAKARQDDVAGKNLERDFSARLSVVETAIQADAGTEEETNDD